MVHLCACSHTYPQQLLRIENIRKRTHISLHMYMDTSICAYIHIRIHTHDRYLDAKTLPSVWPSQHRSYPPCVIWEHTSIISHTPNDPKSFTSSEQDEQSSSRTVYIYTYICVCVKCKWRERHTSHHMRTKGPKVAPNLRTILWLWLTITNEFRVQICHKCASCLRRWTDIWLIDCAYLLLGSQECQIPTCSFPKNSHAHMHVHVWVCMCMHA
jgi:hypothetical protein